jgi:hypothetical protein
MMSGEAEEGSTPRARLPRECGRRLRARGWAVPNNDDVVGAALGERMAESGGLLGRRSYEDMPSYRNTQDSPFKDALNGALQGTSPPERFASHCPSRTRRCSRAMPPTRSPS